VKLSITSHAGFRGSARPPEALELLAQQLGARRDEVSFAKVGSEIVATWGEDVPSSMERDERAEIGRSVVLEIVRDVCERTPELRLDWFAVSSPQ
jgi:hypothetical protein